MERSLTISKVGFKEETPQNKDTTPILEVLHETDSHFQSVTNCNNYRLLDRSQTYCEKMAAKTFNM